MRIKNNNFLSFRLKCNEMERNGEIFEGFLDKLEMTKKNIFHIFVVRIKICSIFAATKRDASLAQLVEQLTLNQWVQGSNP